MGTQDTGRRSNVGHAQASSPPRESGSTHKQRWDRSQKPQPCASKTCIVDGVLLCPLVQLPRLHLLVPLRCDDRRDGRVVGPSHSRTDGASPQAQFRRRTYEESCLWCLVPGRHSPLVARGKGGISRREGCREQNRVLERRARAELVWSFWDKAMLPFTYIRCVSIHAQEMSLLSVLGGANRRTTIALESVSRLRSRWEGVAARRVGAKALAGWRCWSARVRRGRPGVCGKTAWSRAGRAADEADGARHTESGMRSHR
jgi:hypothetical protein